MDWRKGTALNERIQYVFNKGLLSDFTIRLDVDGQTKEYQVHKFMLALTSPVFETMFRNENFDCSSCEINDVEEKTMDFFVKYIYEHKLNLASVKDAWSVYYLAEKYSMESLKDDCLKYVRENGNANNFCTSYKMSTFYDLPALATEFERKILNKYNVTHTLASADFLELTPEALLKLLKVRDIPVREIDIFMACSKWIKNYLKVEDHQSLDQSDVENLPRFENNDSKQDQTIPKNLKRRRQSRMTKSVTPQTTTSNDAQDSKEAQTPVTAQRPEIVKKILSEIYFLDIIPCDFVQVALSGLLTQEETCSILMNLVDNCELLTSQSGDGAFKWPDYFRSDKRFRR